MPVCICQSTPWPRDNSSHTHGLRYPRLGLHGEKAGRRLLTLPELAGWIRRVWPSASGSYLSNVIQRLARAGSPRSHRGVAGGYSLARPADQITLRYLVEVLEGVDLNRCSLSLDSQCPTVGVCSMQRHLLKIEASYLKSLEELTIAALAEDICLA